MVARTEARLSEEDLGLDQGSRLLGVSEWWKWGLWET